MGVVSQCQWTPKGSRILVLCRFCLCQSFSPLHYATSLSCFIFKHNSRNSMQEVEMKLKPRKTRCCSVQGTIYVAPLSFLLSGFPMSNFLRKIANLACGLVANERDLKLQSETAIWKKRAEEGHTLEPRQILTWFSWKSGFLLCFGVLSHPQWSQCFRMS